MVYRCVEDKEKIKLKEALEQKSDIENDLKAVQMVGSVLEELHTEEEGYLKRLRVINSALG